MLRFDDCVCGTSTTGTGTLTLAAPPAAFAGIDPDVWARATGIGFGNSAAFLVDYVITEYTDATNLKEKSKEKGTGTLTLGGSAGVANCTLARTTIDWTATSLDAQPASVNVKPGAGITIATAANVLVTIAPSTLSVPGMHPYFETGAVSDTNWGVIPEGFNAAFITGGSYPNSNIDWHVPFRLPASVLAKRISWRLQTYTAPTGTPIVYVRLYDFGTNGRPGKLLYDFTSVAGITLTAIGSYSTGTPGTNNNGNGFLINAGTDYFMDFALTGVTAGGSGLGFRGPSTNCPNPAAARFGMVNGAGSGYATASSATAGAGPDPANVTLYALVSSGIPPAFGCSAT